MIMGSEKRASSELCVGDLSIGFVELPVTGNWQHAATYRATSQKKIQRTTLQKRSDSFWEPFTEIPCEPKHYNHE